MSSSPGKMKDKLQKINDVEWLLPKSVKANMKVDAKIFGNAKIIEILEDQAIEQLANVASMPGVLEPVLGLPDMHFGYGLPMGAVSAFSAEDGIISAGMCGFDINCISGSSKVLHEFGYRKGISQFENSFHKDRIKCMNPTSKVKDTKINEFMKFSSTRVVYKVRTETGEEIIATEDHPFFTKNGMIKLSLLNEGSEVSVFPFEGVEYEEPNNKIILSEKDIKDKNVLKELKKRKLLPLAYNDPKLPYLLKLIGFLIGDGCVYENKMRAGVSAYSKERKDLETIQKDIEELGYRASIASRERSHKIHTSYCLVEFENVENCLKCNAKSFFHLLKALELPIGNKTLNEFSVPEWILNAKLWQKRLFLAGLFGAELSSPKTVTKHGYNFYDPVLSMNKSEEKKENLKQFLLQIKSLLKEFNIESTLLNEREEYEGKNGKSYRLRLQISSKPKNLIRLWTNIGFEYNNERRYLANASVQYLKKKENVLKQRNDAITKAKRLKQQGKKPRQIYSELTFPYVNRRFLARTLFEGRETPRVAYNFEKFDDFLKKQTDGLGKTGQVWAKIVSKQELPFTEYVYDFNVQDVHHNFVANNFVVSNCGINSIRTNLTVDDVKQKLPVLIDELFKNVPCGVGAKGRLRLEPEQLDDVLLRGANWAIENGYGVKEDLEHMEESGCMQGGDISKVSDLAKKRGKAQLGTLGAGNHFLEIQAVDEIYDKEAAESMGITKKGQVLIMIHCGSRGFGHQVATDYLQVHGNAVKKYGLKIPDRQLACAPFKSPEGQDYFKAMKCAVNYSFTNRLVMTQWIRESFETVFGRDWKSMGMNTVYGLCHNVVKLEKHEVDGKKIDTIVHRKGATRAFPGIPVLIAGSMGTSSYIMLGTEEAMKKSFGSSVHGAGRVMSRKQAINARRGQDVQKEMEEHGRIVRATNPKVLAEEADTAYKPVDEVIESVHNAGISKKVAKLIPLGVCKG